MTSDLSTKVPGRHESPSTDQASVKPVKVGHLVCSALAMSVRACTRRLERGIRLLVLQLVFFWGTRNILRNQPYVISNRPLDKLSLGQPSEFRGATARNLSL